MTPAETLADFISLELVDMGFDVLVDDVPFLLEALKAAGFHVMHDNQAVYNGVVHDLEPSLGHEGYFLLRPVETP